MSTEVDTESTVDVSTEHVTIEKTFESEEFAVPAIKFEISSDSDDPVAIRLVDYIPTDFPMDSVGFHPDYENDNWTAYKDHRVQFERVLDPGEDLTTVYGIRLGDLDEVPSFLGEPDVYEVDLDEIEADLEPAVDAEESVDGRADDGQVEDGTLIDIVSEDSNQVVRDVITGDADTVPGLEDEADESAPDPLATDADTADESAVDPLGADAESSDPLGMDGDAGSDEVDPLSDLDADGADDADTLGEDLEAESIAEPDLPPISDDEAGDEADNEETLDADEEPAEEPAAPVDPLGEVDDDPEFDAESDETEPESDDPIEAPVDGAVDSIEDDDSESEPAAPVVESVGTALATEIREGRVSDADLRILRRELDFEQPESTNVRIRHLQSRVDDLEAYTEALEAFIDENGTAERLLSEYESEVERLGERVEGFESELGPDEGTLERIDELEAQLDAFDFSEEFDGVDRRFDELEELVGANTTDTTALAGDVESLESDIESELESVSDRLSSIDDQLSERLDSLDEELSERLDSFDDDLDDRFDSFEDDLTEIQSEIEDVQQWRSQLGSVFGAQTGE